MARDLVKINIQIDAKDDKTISVVLKINDAQDSKELFNGKLNYENKDLADIFEKLDDLIEATLSSYGDKYGS